MSTTHIPHTLLISPPPPPHHASNMMDCLVISSCDWFVVAVWAVTDSMRDGEHNIVVIPQHDNCIVGRLTRNEHHSAFPVQIAHTSCQYICTVVTVVFLMLKYNHWVGVGGEILL